MTSLKPEQYWKWRHCIEIMNHNNTKVKLGQLMMSFMDKDVEIQKLKLELYKLNRFKVLEEQAEDSKKEYEALKKEIEQEIGQSLNNCVIDDNTFEVKNLD